MFAQLKGVVDLIRSGIAGYRKYRTDQERQENVLGVLKAYFVFKDCVDEGEALIADAGPDPIGKINAMEASVAASTVERWDAVIRRQGTRLYILQGYIFGQDHLAVIDPALQDRIVIGYKMDEVVTLHGIGAALFFRNMLPIANTKEEKARYVSIMAGSEDDTVDMSRVQAEITALREALDQYRMVVERLVSNDELLRLSHRARQETSFLDHA